VCSRIYYGNGLVYHYVLVTSVDESNVYIFDPYYRKNNFKNSQITLIDDANNYNRKVSKERFFSKELEIFSMGMIQERECILINLK